MVWWTTQTEHYLNSILGNLRELRHIASQNQDAAPLGGEVLADNIDWLSCFIDKHKQANADRA